MFMHAASKPILETAMQDLREADSALSAKRITQGKPPKRAGDELSSEDEDETNNEPLKVLLNCEQFCIIFQFTVDLVSTYKA